MIITPNDVKDLVGEENAIAAAKFLNQRLEKRGILLWGTIFSDGRATDWSTEKDNHNMHVGILMGAREMGAQEPMDADINLDGLTPEEELQITKQKLKETTHRMNLMKGDK